MTEDHIKKEIEDCIVESALAGQGSVSENTLLFEEVLSDPIALRGLIDFKQERSLLKTSGEERARECHQSSNGIFSLVNTKVLFLVS